MRLTRADLIDDVLASALKEEGTDELTEAAGQHASVQFSIEQICNGEWSIGGKSTTGGRRRVRSAGK
jgi:hypothetical protein